MDDTNEIDVRLKELTSLIDKFTNTIAPLETNLKAIKASETDAYQHYLATINALRDQQSAIDEQMFEARREINRAKEEARRLEQERQRIEAEKAKAAKLAAQQEEYATLEKRWDMLTAGATWREWAKQHQIDGGHKIVADQKVIVADPMGLGKTLTAIITCDMAEAATKEASPENPFLGEQKEVYVGGHWDGDVFVQGSYQNKIVGGVERPAGRKILYFCPSPMIRNVEREFRMWAKHRNVTFIGGMAKAERNFLFEFILPQQDQYVVICNYEAWRKDFSLLEKLAECEFDTVIIDEAHVIKETKSVGYRGVKQIIDNSKPPYVIPMTGTPILNRPQELYSLLSLVNPEKFSNVNDFLYRYCEQDDQGSWRFIDGGLDLISKLITKNFMRRTRDQAGIELPPKTVTIHELEIDEEAYPHQAKVREQMRKRAMIMIDEAEGKAIAATAVIAMFTRLRQIETWPAGIIVKNPVTKEITLQVDVEESQKIDYLIHWDKETKEWDGLIPEVINDERCVLFSQFKAPLKELKDRIERMGKRAVIYDGDTSNDIKDQVQIDFDARYTPDCDKAKWDIVLCNYKVGGVGVNFTAATQMFILDEEWNPGKRDQAYDRIHRIGQEKPVTVHVIRDKNSIDDWLAGLIEKKQNLVDGFNDTMLNVNDFKEALDSGLI